MAGSMVADIMTAAAQRQRRRRERARRGAIVARIEIDDCAVCEALLLSGRLTEAEAADPSAVERKLGELIGEWAERWFRRHA